MKILVLGDPCSVWEKEFVQYVLLPMGAEVYLQDNHGSEEKYASFYTQAGVTVIPHVARPAFIRHIPKVRVLAARNIQAKRIRQYQPFDIIINMFVSPASLSSAILYKTEDTRVIALFCGSDIIRATPLTCKCLKPNLKKVDSIVLASEAVNDSFVEKIGRLPTTPHQVVQLGVSAFAEIDKVLEVGGKLECKKNMMLSPEKMTICIGYNASEVQNHKEVIKQIKQLPKDVLNRITVILPMTYGGTSEYINSVENEVSQIECEYKLIRGYMDKTQISKLWGATDVFINAQTTDGLSGSVLEALYAGASLVNASWLQYREYDRWALKYESFSDWSQLVDIICMAFKNGNEICVKNREILKRRMSWSLCRESWQKIIDSSIKSGGFYGR